MRYIADLHIHSKYSRATSRDMTPEGLRRWGLIKGVSLIGTGDFTHPAWFSELREKLRPEGNGLFSLRSEFAADEAPASSGGEIRFLLSAEISSIYKKNGRTRKIHSIVFAPDFETVSKINSVLGKRGNISSDGRPILGMDAKELLSIVLDASPEAMLVPAHAWTPHFSIFGAASGFDSIEECFEDLSPYIYAIETGLSSDPDMNRRLSTLDGLTLISNSDAHSPSKVGREANIFETEFSYFAAMEAIKTGRGFSGTIEFFPEEGKYHFDGHRDCRVSMHPEDSIRHGLLCPVCGRKMTIGVMHRVGELADRNQDNIPKKFPPYRYIIPLQEIIAEALDMGVSSKAVARLYMSLIENLGGEFGILLDAPLSDIEAASNAKVREGIELMRTGRVNIAPGYDGEFGKISLFDRPGK